MSVSGYVVCLFWTEVAIFLAKIGLWGGHNYVESWAFLATLMIAILASVVHSAYQSAGEKVARELIQNLNNMRKEKESNNG